MFAKAFSLVTNLTLAALVLGAALPGPHRILAPGSYGLTRIAPRTWTDAPARADTLVALTNRARANVGRFFGDTPPSPTLVLCTSRTCARAFGIGGNGLSLLNLAVLVSPGGLTEGTLSHELTHSRLHRSMGPKNLLRQPYPTWFDEGLATHVANHPRVVGQASAAARQYIRTVSRFWQWDDAFRKLGVGRAYQAAAAEVASIERQAGRTGLLDLIARAEEGEDFDRVLSEVTNR